MSSSSDFSIISGNSGGAPKGAGNSAELHNHKISDMAEVDSFSENVLDKLKILHYGSSNKKLLKSFRELRTKLSKRAGSENYVCMISSVCSGGGASYVAENLAAALTLDRTKTALIVDCNLYSPSVKRLLITDPEVGITDFLYSEELSIENIVYATGIPRLRVVPVGNNVESGAEFFSGGRMKRFVSDLKKRYSDRYIIVVAPPASEYTAESNILAELCDFSVLVVPYGKVTESQVMESVAAIGEKNMAGMVFNN